ncbi:MAG: TrbC/VirB2 family protein [Burkholderiales bacterium]
MKVSQARNHAQEHSHRGKGALSWASAAWTVLVCSLAVFAPDAALAGPFATGAGAAQTNILTILTPVAVIAVMVLGVAAWFNKVSWGWVVAAIGGMVLVFGGPQIVAWVRGMFGV